MYGVGRLQQITTCVFNQFQIYDNIAEKGCAGGLNGRPFPGRQEVQKECTLVLHFLNWPNIQGGVHCIYTLHHSMTLPLNDTLLNVLNTSEPWSVE